MSDAEWGIVIKIIRFFIVKSEYFLQFLDAEDFEPVESGAGAPAATDKWEGEDEDEDVKVHRHSGES